TEICGETSHGGFTTRTANRCRREIAALDPVAFQGKPDHLGADAASAIENRHVRTGWRQEAREHIRLISEGRFPVLKDQVEAFGQVVIEFLRHPLTSIGRASGSGTRNGRDSSILEVYGPPAPPVY